MPHAIRTAIFLSVVLLPRSPATAQAQGAPAEPGANAALQYWQAFALLPAPDEDEQKILVMWNKAPLDATALKLIEKSRGSRDYLHRGAMAPRCDWGLDYGDGIFLRLPHVPKAMTLARLTALHARHEFEQGHGEAGWQDVTDVLTLARHVKAVPVMIEQMVGYVIETTAIEAAAPYLPGLKSALPEAASAALDVAQSGPSLQQMIIMEKRLGPVWLIGELKEAERRKPGSWRGVWDHVFEAIIGGAEGEGVPNRDVYRSVKSFDEAIGMLEGLLGIYDELAKLAALPWIEFDARYPAFAETTKATSPLAALNLPNKDKFVPAQRRAMVRLAMFQAAVAIVQGGPDRLKDVKDPFGDGPFEYRALAGGFELTSKAMYQGKPVTLAVGQRAAE